MREPLTRKKDGMINLHHLRMHHNARQSEFLVHMLRQEANNSSRALAMIEPALVYSGPGSIAAASCEATAWVRLATKPPSAGLKVHNNKRFKVWPDRTSPNNKRPDKSEVR